VIPAAFFVLCRKLWRVPAGPVDVGRKTRVYRLRSMLPKRRTVERRINFLIAGGVLALAAARVASPVLAAQDYPPGLFENSPVVPSGPPDSTAPSGPPDAAFPFGPAPDADDPPDDYCAGLRLRTFRSLAEVHQAHAQCDHVPGAAPVLPPAEGRSDQ
jgi:hypothetical protein